MTYLTPDNIRILIIAIAVIICIIVIAIAMTICSIHDYYTTYNYVRRLQEVEEKVSNLEKCTSKR